MRVTATQMAVNLASLCGLLMIYFLGHTRAGNVTNAQTTLSIMSNSTRNHSATQAYAAAPTSAPRPIVGVIDPFNKEVFRLLTNPPIYKKYLPPQEARPIRVNMSMFLFDFGSINEAQTTFDLHLLLRIVWTDERLRPWNATVSKDQSMAVLEGGAWHLDRLWTPDLHVPNSKVPNILQDSSQNLVLTRVQSDGQILVSKRIILHGTSQMDFRLYPLDVQQIDFEIESNELSYENLQLAWKEEDPFDANEGFHWNGYHMFRHELWAVPANYTYTGAFSRVVARFYLARAFSWQFAFDIYAPIFMYVVISWASFWIDPQEAGARVALCVTVLLTLVTASRTARAGLPIMDYISALDIWITTCVFFVFSSLVEYTAVNYYLHRERRSELKKNKRKKSLWQREYAAKRLAAKLQAANARYAKYAKSSATIEPEVTCEVPTSMESPFEQIEEQQEDNEMDQMEKPKTYFYYNISACCCLMFRTNKTRKEKRLLVNGSREIAYEIDRISRAVFPCLFGLFNLVYWIVIIVASRARF